MYFYTRVREQIEHFTNQKTPLFPGRFGTKILKHVRIFPSSPAPVLLYSKGIHGGTVLVLEQIAPLRACKVTVFSHMAGKLIEYFTRKKKPHFQESLKAAVQACTLILLILPRSLS